MTLEEIKAIEDPAARIAELERSAVKIMETNYRKSLDEPQRQTARNDLADLMCRIGELTDRRAAAVESYNKDIKPLEKQRDAITMMLRRGCRNEFGKLYKFIDYEKKETTLVDAAGDVIERRAAAPAEMQTTIFTPAPPAAGKAKKDGKKVS